MDATNRRRALTWAIQTWRQMGGQETGKVEGEVPYDKPLLVQVFDVADQWATDNAASFNSALPAQFRTTASPELKALVLAAVALRRAGLARTSED